MARQQLGYSKEDLEHSPYASFYNEDLEPLQSQVAEAVLVGHQAEELFPTVREAKTMLEPGYWPVETGFTEGRDKSIRVFCLTHMPGVEPKMWDWWFGWHGSEALRYKLWHPKAHVSARWSDRRKDEAYIGRTSLITEYLGSVCQKASIGFVRPSVLGFDEKRLAAQGEVVVCARIGMQGAPLKPGWLLHQLRPVEGGCEMRSRMWLGGRNVAFGRWPGPLSSLLMSVFGRIARQLLPTPSELLVHNAQEMAHLAGILPRLYQTFGPASDGQTS